MTIQFKLTFPSYHQTYNHIRIQEHHGVVAAKNRIYFVAFIFYLQINKHLILCIESTSQQY